MITIKVVVAIVVGIVAVMFNVPHY